MTNILGYIIDRVLSQLTFKIDLASQITHKLNIYLILIHLPVKIGQ